DFIIRPDIQVKISRKYHFFSVLYPVNERVYTKPYLSAAQLHDHAIQHGHFVTEIFKDWKKYEELDIHLQLYWKGLESVHSTMMRIQTEVTDGGLINTFK